ncbi:MAG TPA: pyridoxal-phosphate dependent enzyme [Candidatus Acidoferrum sp.]|jgi:threonine synthase|nr:pyridoxal-phosphate dependent enzyme [Candidatus Acidoferrum sp.]
MSYTIECSTCGKQSQNLLDYKCTQCNQPLIVKQNRKFETQQIQKKNRSLWRYAKCFPYVKERNIITLGEGWTPLIKYLDNIYFKLENLNPTGSFKDRGSTTLISALHQQIRKVKGYISEDSSGNAGASIAAYAARARLPAKIFVPEKVAGPKFNQIQFYGAQVVKVSGSRNKVAEKAQKTQKDGFYIGHIFHPLFRDGIRTLAYEIAEQLDWQAPERIYLPVSAGTLLLGVLHGFQHLLQSNVIKTMPKIVACQTKQVSPLYHRIKNTNYTPPRKITSIADALVSTNPPLLDLMEKHLKKANGDAVTLEEKETIKAFTELARKGFYVEPSSAVAYAGHKKQLATMEASKEDTTVIILTGTGLKSSIQPNMR